jgi:hypothetical protein
MAGEFDSPFAHVPASDAGPSPLQEGPFTYERLAQSSGRATLAGTRGARVGVFVVFLAVVLLGVVGFMITRLIA